MSGMYESGPGDLEVTATVLNCNDDRNEGIMSACEALRGYSRLLFLARVNRVDAGMSLDEAVQSAVAQCIEEGVLVDYLLSHRAEVEYMLFAIEDEERATRAHREAVAREVREEGLAEGRARGLAEGRARGLAEGREEGRREGILAAIRALMQSQGCDAVTAMNMLQVPKEEWNQFDVLP